MWYETGFYLTPVVATAIFVAAVISGSAFRNTWKFEGPTWQLWVFGIVAAVGLMTVALIPIRPG